MGESTVKLIFDGIVLRVVFFGIKYCASLFGKSVRCGVK